MSHGPAKLAGRNFAQSAGTSGIALIALGKGPLWNAAWPGLQATTGHDSRKHSPHKKCTSIFNPAARHLKAHLDFQKAVLSLPLRQTPASHREDMKRWRDGVFRVRNRSRKVNSGGCVSGIPIRQAAVNVNVSNWRRR